MIRTAAAAAAIALLVANGARAEDDAERIRRAVAHTLAMQLPSGLFRYDFDFLDAASTGEDNIVRQAGALFALGAYLGATGDRAVAAPMQVGLDALAQRSLPIGTGTVQSWLERAGVFGIDSWRLERALSGRGWLYAPEGDGRVVSGDESYAGAFSGATALALIAELAYRRATGDDRFAEMRASWLRGLLALQVASGAIRDHPDTLQTGPYVNGETWLALALYHDAFPDDADAAHALVELEDYVLDHYRRAPDRSFYHWGALSSAARLERGDPARLAEFAADQTEFILREVPPDKTKRNTTCSLIEGLGSAIAVIRSRPGREDLLARMQERVARELAHNRTLQIRAGQRRLPLGGGGELRSPSLADLPGAFLEGSYTPYTRIDLTQHCISAFLIAERYGLAGGASGKSAARSR